MAINQEAYLQLKAELDTRAITLVAVSKTKPVEDIRALYELGQRDFGENYVQELVEKAEKLPADIRWHFIGHLQRNKVRFIAPFVQLIHGVDSLRLLEEINKQAAKIGRVIDCLLQVHIAREETKFGMDEQELELAMEKSRDLSHVRVTGLMGMASFTEDMDKVRGEFKTLKMLFDKQAAKYREYAASFTVLSMGMSGDYRVAVEEGSTLVRIGSLLFGERVKA